MTVEFSKDLLGVLDEGVAADGCRQRHDTAFVDGEPGGSLDAE